MRILRESQNKEPWVPEERYQLSYYNISEQNDKNTVIYNSASGAVAIMDTVSFENQNFNSDVEQKLVENGF